MRRTTQGGDAPPPGSNADSPAPGRWPFLRTPLACRAWITTTVLAAVAVPVLLDHRIGHGHTSYEPLTALVIVMMSALNIEIGRLLEGGTCDVQRPHKALSTWSFASALVLSIGWLLPVVALCYAHGRWRGMRVPLWKWVGSAAYVVVAGVVAAVTADLVLAGQASLTSGNGLRGMLAVLAGAAAFLGTETLLFHGSAYLNSADDEAWLRQTLAHGSFYLTEGGVLLVGGLAAAVWNGGAWFLVLLLPIFVLAQRAALHEPLRERADHDDKTGLLRFESWHRMARASAAQCNGKSQAWSVLFVDLDHFKRFNDTWGHLAGDLALVTVAGAIRHEVRASDIVARFGGEEFCVFLPRADLDEARQIAERIRLSIESADLPGEQALTISAGVAAASPPARDVDLDVALLTADRALYEAKSTGRNGTCARVAAPPERVGAKLPTAL
ncbi:MAG TPA: GGDEF domain-containing protein [Nocardioides sp.]|nr:GGDEF domain-containing protein [Nocardioides sp.]